MIQSYLGFVNKNVENNFPGKLWHELRLVNKKLLPESERHVFFYKKYVYKEASSLAYYLRFMGDGVKLNGVRGKLLNL